ncbi:hypothetical protein ACM26V_03605 [Salipaludibacillus sp. HK11]|uniref:hypothetical protein n=1 Tax=Salipaludibacillus sp. HK11 TaxID=3394320 RepID=UPI0039FC0D72
MNAFKSGATSAAGAIPGASSALSVYDVAKSFVSGISKETTITDAEISYTWAQLTTAVFSYVKKQGQSDNYQKLSYISTKVETSIGWQYPTFTYSGGKAKANVIQGSRDKVYIPTGYNSTTRAINAYLDVSAPKRSVVDKIALTGIETKTISNINPVSPQFPAHIR